jgi:putative phosphoesterase
MHIVVLSDTHLGDRRHGPLPARVEHALGGADLILHGGDVTVAGVLDELAAYAPVEAVLGNMDGPDVAARVPVDRVIEAGGVRIGMVHIPGPDEGRRERLRARFPGCSVVIFGHTHIPVCDDRDGLLLLNPGSPTERRRGPYHSYAELDVDGGAVTSARIIPLDA